MPGKSAPPLIGIAVRIRQVQDFDVMLIPAQLTNRLKHVGVLMSLLTVPAVSTAHAQSIVGFVIEHETRTPISGATLELSTVDGKLVGRAVSDSSGAFEIRAEQLGPHILRVSHP